MLDKIKNLITRFESLEGVGIILFCLLVIAMGPIAKLLAYAGVVYGLWKVWKAISD